MVRPGILDPWWSQQQMCLLSSGDKAAVAAAWSVSRLNNFQGMLPGYGIIPWLKPVAVCMLIHGSRFLHIESLRALV